VNTTDIQPGASSQCSVCGWHCPTRPVRPILPVEHYPSVCTTCLPLREPTTEHDYRVLLTPGESGSYIRARVFHMQATDHPLWIADISRPQLDDLRRAVLARIDEHHAIHHGGVPATVTLTAPDGRFTWPTDMDMP